MVEEPEPHVNVCLRPEIKQLKIALVGSLMIRFDNSSNWDW